MELVIILAVVAFGVWYFFFRDKELVKEATSEAPYKVDVPPVSEPVVQEVVVVKTPEPVVVETPVVAEAPAKPKRAPRPKAETTTTAKDKASVKAPTKAKAPAKPRAKAPKMTVAK